MSTPKQPGAPAPGLGIWARTPDAPPAPRRGRLEADRASTRHRSGGADGALSIERMPCIGAH